MPNIVGISLGQWPEIWGSIEPHFDIAARIDYWASIFGIDLLSETYAAELLLYRTVDQLDEYIKTKLVDKLKVPEVMAKILGSKSI